MVDRQGFLQRRWGSLSVIVLCCVSVDWGDYRLRWERGWWERWVQIACWNWVI